MTNKFDGNLWKWLLANVMAKLAPSTATASEGQVLTVGADGAMQWSDASTGRDVPDTSGASDGDVLTVGEEGAYGWEALPAVNEVPNAAAASDGDVLTADGAGGYAWQTPGGASVRIGQFKVKKSATQHLISSSAVPFEINYGDLIQGLTNPVLKISAFVRNSNNGVVSMIPAIIADLGEEDAELTGRIQRVKAYAFLCGSRTFIGGDITYHFGVDTSHTSSFHWIASNSDVVTAIDSQDNLVFYVEAFERVELTDDLLPSA